MRRSSATLLMLLALAGCAAHRPRSESATASPAATTKRAIVRVDVTNTFGRSIDVYYSSTFLGSLGPYGHGSYTVPPTTRRVPVYARWSRQPHRSFNISRSHGVHYVYGNAEPPDG
jgi:hypothetical protein